MRSRVRFPLRPPTDQSNRGYLLPDRGLALGVDRFAPRKVPDLLIAAAAEQEHLVLLHYEFPADDVALHVCEIDLRVGGQYHYAWYAPGAMECSFLGQFLEIERPTRIVSTWLFEGWPDDEAIETVILAEYSGITTMTDIMDFKTRDNLGDHFQENDGAQASWNKLDDLLADLQAERQGTPGSPT